MGTAGGKDFANHRKTFPIVLTTSITDSIIGAMTDLERYKLLHGPYETPVFRYGERVLCEYMDREVEISGLSSGRIQWPTSKRRGGYPIVVCGRLADAVRTESEIAIAYWWGVSKTTVYKWRRALGVGRVTDGTHRLYVNYHPEKAPHEFSNPVEAGKAGGAVRGEQLRGKPASPQTRAKLTAAARKPKSAEWKQKAAERGRLRIPKGSHMNPNLKPWTDAERALLGTSPDREVAAAIGRTIHAVRCERRNRKIPAFGVIT